MELGIFRQWFQGLDQILLGPTTTVFLSASLILLLYLNRVKKGEEPEDGNQDEE